VILEKFDYLRILLRPKDMGMIELVNYVFDVRELLEVKDHPIDTYRTLYTYFPRIAVSMTVVSTTFTYSSSDNMRRLCFI